MNTRRWAIRSILTGIVLGAVFVVLAVLAFKLRDELFRLRSAATDNVQWSMAQMQVEMLTLEDAVTRAIYKRDTSLAEVRQRFDIFYSRISTVRNGKVFAIVNAEERARTTLKRIVQTLDAATPLIDGPDDALRAHLPLLDNQLRQIQADVRQLSLDGVTVFARNSDRERMMFGQLLIQTALAALAFIIALLVALALLVRQYRLSRQRTEQLQESNLRYASAIHASLDPIIVIDSERQIQEFNPAAERTFGYMRQGVLGAAIETLIIPDEFRAKFHQSMARHLSADDHATGFARIEMPAMQAGGERFDAEFSLGLSQGSHGPIITIYIRDISARLRYESALTKARDEALAAAKAKSDFLAVMSHEMRTPLNGVMGILDLLRGTRLSAAQKAYVKTAITSGEILQQHIDDVLDITRVESGAAELKPDCFDVGELLDEIERINEPAARNRGNTLYIDADSAPQEFVQDRHRLRQVLLNLVGNAIKFTTCGRITISVMQSARQEDTGSLHFCVTDTGMGIAPEDRERIFDDFVMLDPSYKRNAPGTGLGLGICRRLVDLMGGEIGVESTPGKGSSFWFELPALKPVEAMRSQEPAPSATFTAKHYGLSILLVEDNEINRLVAREMLQHCGCKVTEAVDGGEGYVRAKEQCFDLILMDVSMPDIDGIAATRLIRSSDGPSKNSTIIGLTAHALPDEQKSLLAAGMQDCLVKPLRLEALDRILARISAGREASGSHANQQVDDTAMPDLFDKAILHELVDTLPAELLSPQIERFMNELTAAEDEFGNSSLVCSNQDNLARQAHRYAGSAAVFGARALHTLLRELETAARSGQIDQTEELCKTVARLARQTRTALPGYLKHGSKTAQ